MASIVLRPSSGRGSDWNNIPNIYDNNESTYATVYTNKNNYTDRELYLTFDMSAIPVGSVINSATLTARVKSNNASYLNLNVFINGAEIINNKLLTSVMNRTGDISNQLEHLRGGEMTVQIYSSSSSSYLTTLYELYIDVDYTPPTSTTIRRINIGNSSINTIHLGDTKISKVYLGTNLIFEG